MSSDDQFRIAYVDIETSPNLGWVWGKYQQDVVEFEEEWHLLSVAVKWGGEKKVQCWALPDFTLYKKSPDDDRELAKKLWEVFDRADLVVAHNLLKFDRKRSNTRFLENRLSPPSPYKTVDTLQLARKHFAFNSNRLDDLCQKLGIGRKVKHEGFKLWRSCMAGDMAAWKRMKRYNAHDVVLLEKVHVLLRGWDESHPNVAIKRENPFACPSCGSTDVQSRGWWYAQMRRCKRYQCKRCGKWSKGAYEKIPGTILR